MYDKKNYRNEELLGKYGEVGLIVAGVGVTTGILTSDVYSTIVIMVAATIRDRIKALTQIQSSQQINKNNFKKTFLRICSAIR